MKILWIDPGGTSGWASYWCNEMESPFGTEYLEEKWLTGELHGENHHERLEHLIQLHHDEFNFTLGYESWQLRKQNGQTVDNMVFDTLEYIGVIKLVWAHENGHPTLIPLVSQTPSERLFADKRKMDIWNLWRLTSGQKDARAAAQHLLTFLIKTMKYPPILKRLEEGLNT